MKKKIIMMVQVLIILVITILAKNLYDYYVDKRDFESLDRKIKKASFVNKNFKDENRTKTDLGSPIENKVNNDKHPNKNGINNGLYNDKHKDENTENIPSKQQVEANSVEVDFDNLNKISKNAVAWIRIPSTKINYPIVQAKDNQFYYENSYENTNHAYGSIFLDNRNNLKFTDQNIIIYGASPRSGYLFNSLKKYKEVSFFHQQPYIYIYTPQKTFIYRIVAAYEENSKVDYNSPFYSDTEWRDFWNRVNKKNIYDIMVPTNTKYILTLTSKIKRGQNFVIHAIPSN